MDFTTMDYERICRHLIYQVQELKEKLLDMEFKIFALKELFLEMDLEKIELEKRI